MKIVQLTIKTDSRLVDALTDYLLGMHDAAVECGVGENGDTPAAMIMHGFIQVEDETVHPDEMQRQLTDYAAELAAIFNAPAPKIDMALLAEQDWSSSWKQHFRPFRIITGLVIAPSWETVVPGPDEQMIIMDPGMAFGTGHHATTRLCLELLTEAVRRAPGCRVLDVGTGTGILAMAAALFGAAAVTALDNDPDAVAAARINVARNHLQEQVRVAGDALAAMSESYQVVIANIVHDTLLELADDLARLTAAGGTLILSGLICGQQVDSLVARLAALSFTVEHCRQDEEWCAMALTKTKRLLQQ